MSRAEAGSARGDAAALAAERILRVAAVRTNLLLAGSRVEVRGAGPVPERLRAVLAACGARLSGADRPVLTFLAGDAGEEQAAAAAAELLAGSGPLPAILVLDRAAAPSLWRDAAAEARPGVAERSDGLLLIDAAERRDPAELPGAATAGAARIAWARRFMPVTARLSAELLAGGVLAGRRVGISLVLEPKTCVLALALRDAGAEVAVFAPANETDPVAADALRAEGIEVAAPGAHHAAGDAEHAARLLDWGPELLIDDGAHLIRLAHTERPAALAALLGAAEETTSGVRPLREMAAEGALRVPVIAVNDARTKTLFDNLHGTGQSCVFAIADLLDGAIPGPGLAGRRWAVLGYGPVGAGTARHAAALGASVTVVDPDPVRALSALHDGHAVAAAAAAIADADTVVSATGVWHTVTAAEFAAAGPDAVFAVAGGIDDELALEELRAAGWAEEPAGRGITRWLGPAGERLRVLADGGGVNYTAGEGNPIEVMDLAFGTQLAALRELLAAGPGAARLRQLSASAEAEVARIALAVRAGVAVPPAAAGPGRIGGAAQHWREHRYRSAPPA